MIESLGEALGDELVLSTCRARFYEKGLILEPGGNELIVRFGFPMIGQPRIATGDALAFPPEAMAFTPGTWSVDRAVSAVAEAVTGRLHLVATGLRSLKIPVTVGGATLLGQQRFGLAIRAGLEDRRLYDVALELGSAVHIIAPHSLYRRTSWTDFGLAHITDMHVARRIDSFRELLRAANLPDEAAGMYNWNDRFRGFVRYANYLHEAGHLDVIVCTGDLYDYIFENDDDHRGGGNAEWLRKLILGEAPGPDFADVEELHVPIFTVPGNHDYRTNPYKPVFDVVVNWGVASESYRKKITNYAGYHLSEKAALALTNRLAGRSAATDDTLHSVDADGAGAMVAIIADNAPYRTQLAPLGPYIIELGPHRIAMVDSAYDEGVVSGVLNAALVGGLGIGTEDELTFVGGSPNCVGVTDNAFAVVADALDRAPDDGLFIVGLHAPLFNVWNNEYPYFLRQSQRPADHDDAQTIGFLARGAKLVVRIEPSERVPDPRVGGESEARQKEMLELARASAHENHRQWFPGDRDHRQAAFVARAEHAHAAGDEHVVEAMLRFGVSRHRAEDLTARLGGLGSRRPADVVLAGHTHRHNEFSLQRTFGGELAFYMDFYTENPTSYYPTRFTTGWAARLHASATGSEFRVSPMTDVTYVDVVPGSPAEAVPEPLTTGSMYKNVVRVPPYARPLLSEATDVRAWWAEHRPLVLQTGALGPLDTSQVSFSGFRMLMVRNNVIQKIHFLSTERLERAGYRLSWEEAIKPAPPVSRSRPGELVLYRDRARDGTGDVNTPSLLGLGGWQTLKHLSADGNGAIYAVDAEGRLLYYRDPTRDGTTLVAGPSVIGLGGWGSMRHVFSGGDGIIYAIDEQGRLLFYRDNTRDGTGDVSNPAVIGLGGWQQFSRVFSGGNGIIYAVDQAGRLLFYRDSPRNGTGDVSAPGVIGLGGWQSFTQLFSGGDGCIYAVDDAGRLLFYKDHRQDGTGDVSAPTVVGRGGWDSFASLFSGGDGIIYAVRR